MRTSQKHPKPYVGEKFTNKQGNVATVRSLFRVGKRLNAWITFDDEYGHCMSVHFSILMTGAFKNPYFKSVNGRGYLGYGKYLSVNAEGNKCQAYNRWYKLMFSNKEVSDDMRCFQTFAKEYYDNKTNSRFKSRLLKPSHDVVTPYGKKSLKTSSKSLVSKEKVVINKFIVEDFVMGVFRGVANDCDLIMQETDIHGTYTVVSDYDVDYCEMFSVDIVLDEYFKHNENYKNSYSNYALKYTFEVLDNELTDDAKTFGLEPHVYLSILAKLQCCHSMMKRKFHQDEVPKTWVMDNSFDILASMHSSKA